MSVMKHILKIKDTLYNLVHGSMAANQTALVTDDNNRLISAGDDAVFRFYAIEKSTEDGVVFTKGDVDFGTVTGETVNVDSADNETIINLKNSGTTKGQLYWDNIAEAVSIQGANSAPISLQPTGGGVGIGTLIPTCKLTVESSENTDSLNTQILMSNLNATAGDGDTTFNRASVVVTAGNGTVTGRMLAANEPSGEYGNSLLIGSRSNHPTRIIANDIKRMTINTDGRIGIGSDGDSEFLSITDGAGSGELQISTNTINTRSGIALKRENTLVGALYWDENTQTLRLEQSSSKPIVLQQDGGNVGIGIAAPVTTNMLEVNGRTAATEFLIGSGEESDNQWRIAMGADASNNLVIERRESGSWVTHAIFGA